MKEGDESGEYQYFAGEPSPLEGVVFYCISNCRMILRYHSQYWEEVSQADHDSYYHNGLGIRSHCPDHWNMIKGLKQKQEDDDES